MRYFIHLAYKGTAFHGWQKQPNDISVQGIVEDTLSQILCEKINLIGAGRTDAGVHAECFYAHFDTDVSFDLNRLKHSLNTMLPSDIGIYRVFPVCSSMHARFSAVSRTYQYTICRIKNPFLIDTAMVLYADLDIQKMNEAAALLYKYQDFTSFSKLHTDVNNNNCSIYSAEWKKIDSTYVFTISANRFLRNMVRAIAGTLIDVGLHKIDVETVAEIIESQSRQKAGKSVDARGLSLVDIVYPEGFDVV
ncbi:MAG: tRNA pseudouridine(38-40) synthase TruA [Bacteroidales bacterium]|nr:tRNA pseudouridine(38-40) synthase TruA [Bacteroidales bacterium]